jgi:hypothetical protein
MHRKREEQGEQGRADATPEKMRATYLGNVSNSTNSIIEEQK